LTANEGINVKHTKTKEELIEEVQKLNVDEIGVNI